MQICVRCGNGDQRLKPGSVASGVFCQGCGARLIPEKADPATPAALEAPAADPRLQQALEANRTILASLYDARTKLDIRNADFAVVTAENDRLKAEIAAIRSAMATAAPATAAVAPAASDSAPAVDFHGVPIQPAQ